MFEFFFFLTGAKGVAGGIPAAYAQIEKSFYDLCEKKKQNDRIRFYEFVRPGWTYHAKGLWYSMPGQQKPFFTLIGSPNFGMLCTIIFKKIEIMMIN